jgi:hypothetical protein
MDLTERKAVTEMLRQEIGSASGAALDRRLAEQGWADLLDEFPQIAVPAAFTELGLSGSHAPLLNDVVLAAAGLPLGGTLPLPFTGGSWVVWEREDRPDGAALDPGLPLVEVAAGDELPWGAGRRALGWWLCGTARAMLTLAVEHAKVRTQFGRPVASFQAVRHRLSEALVAVEGAEATLEVADDEFGCLLAKAAAGKAALTVAKHAQQVLGGIGFTAEHDLHRHLRRTLVLDGLLGSARELTHQAGEVVLERGSAPRLADL